MRALTAHREPAAMAQAAVAAKVHQALDVQLDFAPEIALNNVVAVDHLADVENLLVRELRHAPLRRKVQLFHDLAGLRLADAMDVLQRNNDALVGRKIDTRDTSHSVCSCCRTLPAVFSAPGQRREREMPRRHPPLGPGRHRRCAYAKRMPGIKGFQVVPSTSSNEGINGVLRSFSLPWRSPSWQQASASRPPCSPGLWPIGPPAWRAS